MVSQGVAAFWFLLLLPCSSIITFCFSFSLSPPARGRAKVVGRAGLALRGAGGGEDSENVTFDDYDDDDLKIKYIGICEKGVEPSIEQQQNEDLCSLPIFPLGGITYTPGKKHTLNIFEPRYRKMYDDILFSGGRRFVVLPPSPNNNNAVKPEEVSFGKYGCVLYLSNLNDVEDRSSGVFKYIVEHDVVGIVECQGFLNKSVWFDKSDYLKGVFKTVEVDNGAEANAAANSDDDHYDDQYDDQCKELEKTYNQLVSLQQSLNLPIRFTSQSTSNFSTGSGFGRDSVWTTINLFYKYREQVLLNAEQVMQSRIQSKLLDYINSSNSTSLQGPDGGITFDSLPTDLQSEIKTMQTTLTSSLSPQWNQLNNNMYYLIQNRGTLRIRALKRMVTDEVHRINGEAVIKNLGNKNS